MNLGPLILASAALATYVVCGCASAPGRPVAGDIPTVPGEISDFHTLYKENCAGCHGTEGKGGAAIALANPVYLAIADDSILHDAATNGITGTSMPAFAKSAGGLLTAKQVGTIVGGIRQNWSQTNALQGANPPPYAPASPGIAVRGAGVYDQYCSSCHGIGGHGATKASSIVNGSFLALLTDQELRTLVIVGRPELGAPDWRNNVPGKPMSAQEISDVVAWLSSQRPEFPGQPSPDNPKPAGGNR